MRGKGGGSRGRKKMASDECLQKGWSPLHFACYEGREGTARCLLSLGACLEMSDGPDRVRPLHAAAMAGKTECIELLIDAGAQPMAADKEGRTALHHAASHGSPEAVAALCLLSEDPFQTSKAGLMCFHSAARNGCDAALYTLFDLLPCQSVDVLDGSSRTPLYHAAAEGHLHIIRWLLAKGACLNHVDRYGSTPLHAAAQNGHKEVVCHFIESGTMHLSKPDKSRRTPVHYAAANGHCEVVLQILGAIKPPEETAVQS
ncbi:Alpha-latrotoxin-Lh1a [Diplonema papillatum]|nr:Alpha-latrotoxin-Lh1a [Diplonema papillatum]